MFTPEFLEDNGFTPREIQKYFRGAKEKLAADRVTRNVYLNVQERGRQIEAEQLKGVKKQKDMLTWSIETAAALNKFNTAPEGYKLLRVILHEELQKLYTEGFNGVIPTLSTIDNVGQRKMFQLFEEIEFYYSDVAVAIKFDAPAYCNELRTNLGDLWFTGDTEHFEAYHSTIEPTVLDTGWVRDNQFRKEVRALMSDVLVNFYPSMNRA